MNSRRKSLSQNLEIVLKSNKVNYLVYTPTYEFTLTLKEPGGGIRPLDIVVQALRSI